MKKLTWVFSSLIIGLLIYINEPLLAQVYTMSATSSAGPFSPNGPYSPQDYLWVGASSTQSVTSASNTTVNFSSTALASVGSDITFGSNTTVTFAVAGLYHLTAGIVYQAAATNTRGAWFHCSQKTSGETRVPSAGATYSTAFIISYDYLAAANDTCYIVTFQDSGSTIVLTTDAGYSYFQVHQVY